MRYASQGMEKKQISHTKFHLKLNFLGLVGRNKPHMAIRNFPSTTKNSLDSRI